ncbi:MAG TPA: hypothetical protein VGC84_00850, partial [Ilumatobacteraceae bacterium]
PTGRNHLRYFDGVKWTDHVTTQAGVQTLDPVQMVVNEPVVASSPPPLAPPPAPPAAPPAMTAPQTAPTASVGAAFSSLNVTKPTIVAGIATIAALVGSLSMSWVTGTGDFEGTGVPTSLSIDRGGLSTLFDQGLAGADLYRPFVQVGWILAPIVCALAVLLTLGYARKVRVWTIVLALVTTLWAIGTAHALSASTDGETDSPAAGLYVVIAASAVAFVIAIVTRKSTAASQPPA